MANFLAELKRRNLFRVGAAYAVVAWILLQLVNNLTPALRLPDWASSLVVVLLLVGFPVALLFTWARDLPPETDASPRANSKLDWSLLSALVVVIALLSYQQLSLPLSTRTADSQQADGAPTREVPAPPAGTISIAVLPFENLSADPDQEFFSAGMTEEITTALAKIPDLRVVARTSAFQFKDQNPRHPRHCRDVACDSFRRGISAQGRHALTYHGTAYQCRERREHVDRELRP